MRSSVRTLAWLAACLLATAVPSFGDAAEVGVVGRVLDGASPLGAARVYAYQLADLTLRKVTTDEKGRFEFGRLPAGLYKVIAHKAGFLPAVVLLTRATADAYQFLELQLTEEPEATTAKIREDFWSLRAEIPPDVLRQMTAEEVASVARATPFPDDPQHFHAEMQAMTGVDEIATASASQVTSGKLGIQGQLGGFRVGLRGDYRQLQPRTFESAAGRDPGGQLSALELKLDDGVDTRVDVSSLTNRASMLRGVDLSPVDFEHYKVSVSQALGEGARSQFSAQYTSQNNFHRSGGIEPMEVPQASRSWRVEGSYATQLGERMTLETGLRYRERDLLSSSESRTDSIFGSPTQDRVDLFGRGGLQIEPTVLVEYGLYTTLRDGSLSLAPRGGVVVNLGSDWQASASASQKLAAPSRDTRRDFAPILYEEADSCEQGEEHCYELSFARREGKDGEISLGAVHREFGETMRLYFSDDLFNRQESLYLVPGDRLPELRFAVSRRITPRILARLRSNLASGGGGVFYATDREAYENQVRYLVTSLDTRFEGTSTGLFIAFHHLEQQLSPVAPGESAPTSGPVETERLQLMLTQDLNLLFNLPTDWAVQLNMEISRASSPFDHGSGDEFRKRILGGIAVRF